jgi:hypothetical protein
MMMQTCSLHDSRSQIATLSVLRDEKIASLSVVRKNESMSSDQFSTLCFPAERGLWGESINLPSKRSGIELFHGQMHRFLRLTANEMFGVAAVSICYPVLGRTRMFHTAVDYRYLIGTFGCRYRPYYRVPAPALLKPQKSFAWRRRKANHSLSAGIVRHNEPWAALVATGNIS